MEYYEILKMCLEVYLMMVKNVQNLISAKYVMRQNFMIPVNTI